MKVSHISAIVCNFPQSGGVMRRFDPIQIESCSDPDGLVLFPLVMGPTSVRFLGRFSPILFRSGFVLGSFCPTWVGRFGPLHFKEL